MDLVPSAHTNSKNKRAGAGIEGGGALTHGHDQIKNEIASKHRHRSRADLYEKKVTST
jgi:hypothetical protein